METKELITHPEMVAKLLKPGEEILAQMTPQKMSLLHATSKLCSEAGELMDAVGKWCFYNKPLDRENVIEELGDGEFYEEAIRQILDIARSTTLQANIMKLGKRYPNFEYSDQKAQERADKQTPIVRDMLD